ncbi:hypothetical protein ACQFN5_29070 (plasmid) [Klebsiella sp. WOUb02]|uniref:hypothetical protein n=1 Tax=Klebsiella sp. WOUb02 TaxID=3161071 RepID=UPI003CF1E3FE
MDIKKKLENLFPQESKENQTLTGPTQSGLNVNFDSYLPVIESLDGMRFSEIDVEWVNLFPFLKAIAYAKGVMLSAEVHSGPDNSIVQTPEGMDEKELVDWYIENNALVSVWRFRKRLALPL